MIRLAKHSKDIPPNEVEYLFSHKLFNNLKEALEYLYSLGFTQQDINQLIFIKEK